MDFAAVPWLMGIVAVLTTGGALAGWKSHARRVDALEDRERSRTLNDGALTERVKSLDERTERIETKLDRVLERGVR